MRDQYKVLLNRYSELTSRGIYREGNQDHKKASLGMLSAEEKDLWSDTLDILNCIEEQVNNNRKDYGSNHF